MSDSDNVVRLVHEQPCSQAEFEAAIEAIAWVRERVLYDLDWIERLLRESRFPTDRGAA
jgi:hypothetical protein